MLRVFGISGTELAVLPMNKLASSMDKKTHRGCSWEACPVNSIMCHMRKIHGFPICIQRLLHDGTSLTARDKLGSPADLQLVLLDLANVSASIVAEELIEYAAMNGDIRIGLVERRS